MADETGINCLIEMSRDSGATFVDITADYSKITPERGARKTGTKYSGARDYAHIGKGKREECRITLSLMYKNGTSETPAIIGRDFVSGLDTIQLRWSPAGGAAGDKEYTTLDGFWAECTDPELDAESADPLMFEAVLVCPDYVEGEVGS